MSVREAIGQKRGLGIGVGVGLIVLAAVAIAAEVRSVRPSGGGHPGLAFYSDDDGQTWYTDSIYKFPPFDHNGRTASRAYVYSSGKTMFVGFLQRYTPQALAALRKADDNGAGSRAALEKLMSSSDIRRAGSELKLPGPTNHWMSGTEFSTQLVKSPVDGGPAQIVAP